MGRLGVSIYPEHSTPEKDKAYLTIFHIIRRIFTCYIKKSLVKVR